MTSRLFGTLGLALLMISSSCGEGDSEKTSKKGSETTVKTTMVDVPAFNPDSAFDFVAAQVAFGPRVPGTPAQQACASWLEEKLKAFCDTVYRQSTSVTGGDKKALPCINLIGAINPSAPRRILLLAHWDTRPWADADTKDRDKAILGADDGASGVGVLLEIARTLKAHPLPKDLGIDILFTDVEDYGRSEWGEDSYCLGTQYWARNPHVRGYRAEFGILLDMVGGRGARFPLEQSSAHYAYDVQQRVWQAAARIGYGTFFPFTPSQGGVTDDHVYVNELAKIPTIDIIHLTDATRSNFPAHWHTHNDNMSVIDKSTLKAVGQTLLQVLFESSPPA